MNNTIKLLLGAGTAAYLFFFLKKKKAALENITLKNVNVYIDIDKTRKIGFLKLFYNLKILLYNEANVSVNIKSLEAKFYLNGIQFADINSNLSTIIEAKKDKTINIAASVNSGNIIASIFDIISEGKAKISVEGSLLTDLGLIEFSKETIV